MAEKIVKIGEIIESLPGAMFRVKLEDNGEIICYLSGKLRLYHIKILVGDKVKVEISPYDKKKGRIIERI